MAFCLALLMWLASSLVSSVAIPFGARVGVALALVVIGQSISISGMVSFRRAKTTMNPIKASAASSLVFVLYINRFQINPEERVLSSLFGAEYATYKEKVRWWL